MRKWVSGFFAGLVIGFITWVIGVIGVLYLGAGEAVLFLGVIFLPLAIIVGVVVGIVVVWQFGKMEAEENKSDTNTLQKNNERVFVRGAFFGLVLCMLMTAIAYYRSGYHLYHRTQYYTEGGLLQIMTLFFVVFILVFVVINVVIYGIFILINRRSIEMSGIKKWLFYTFEFVVAITPLLLQLYMEVA